jgi:hypothetical protein
MALKFFLPSREWRQNGKNEVKSDGLSQIRYDFHT